MNEWTESVLPLMTTLSSLRPDVMPNVEFRNARDCTRISNFSLKYCPTDARRDFQVPCCELVCMTWVITVTGAHGQIGMT